MYCIFKNNQNTLFSVWGGSLEVSHSFIDHSASSFSTSIAVSISNNNSFTNAITYQLQFFNDLHCNADMPLPQRTPYQSPMRSLEETIIRSNEETLRMTLERTIDLTFKETPTITQGISSSYTKTIDGTIIFVPSEIISSTLVNTIVSTLVYTNSSTQTITSSNGESSLTFVSLTGYISLLETLIVYHTISITQVPSFAIIGNNSSENFDSLFSKLVFIIIGSFLLLLISYFMIYCYITSDINELTTESCEEMNEDTAIIVEDSPSTAVTNDNPLWSTSRIGENDDPFIEDFEEERNERVLHGLAARV